MAGLLAPTPGTSDRKREHRVLRIAMFKPRRADPIGAVAAAGMSSSGTSLKSQAKRGPGPKWARSSAAQAIERSQRSADEVGRNSPNMGGAAGGNPQGPRVRNQEFGERPFFNLTSHEIRRTDLPLRPGADPEDQATAGAILDRIGSQRQRGKNRPGEQEEIQDVRKERGQSRIPPAVKVGVESRVQTHVTSNRSKDQFAVWIRRATQAVPVRQDLSARACPKIRNKAHAKADSEDEPNRRGPSAGP